MAIDARIERLGRDFGIVIPDEALNNLGWNLNDGLTLAVQNGSLVVTRAEIAVEAFSQEMAAIFDEHDGVLRELAKR